MANISKLKRELASRYLYETVRGKSKELAIVSGFLDRFQLNPVTVTESERPDFSLSFGNGALHVGLELTTLNADAVRLRGSPERRAHSQWKKVAVTLRNRLSQESEPLPHVYGSIFFQTSSASALNGLDCAMFCDEVATSLRRAQLSELGSQITIFDPADTPLLADLVSRIFVRVFPHEKDLLWWSADLQSGVIVDPDSAIKAAIVEKRQKALSYEWGVAQERWLVIYAAGEGLADIAAAIENPRIEDPSPFTQIFLWDKFSETIHRLSPEFTIVLEKGKTLYLRHLPSCVHPYLKKFEMKQSISN